MLALILQSTAFVASWLVVPSLSESNLDPLNQQCSFDYVYYMHKKQKDMQSRNVYMKCVYLPVCDRLPKCFYSEKASCSEKFEYLAGIQISADKKSHTERCCQYQIDPSSQAVEFCVIRRVSDIRNNSRSVRQAPIPPAASPARRSDVQITPVNINNKEGLFPTNQLVKSIRSVGDDLEIVMCTITCSTSTSTARPTPPSRNGAELAALAAVAAIPANSDKPVDKPSEGATEGGEEPPSEGGFLQLPPSMPKLCFAGDNFLETRHGPKQMKDLLEGDEVLVAAYTSTDELLFAYEKVEWFLHRLPNVTAQFLTLRTDTGRTLTLSDKHLIPLMSCDFGLSNHNMRQLISSSSQFAYKAKPGMCLIARGKQDNRWTLEKIVQVDRTQTIGIFAPITKSGTLVVNDILASCFAELEDHNFQRDVFNRFLIYRHILQWLSDIVGRLNFIAGNIGSIPWYVDAGLKSVSSVFI